MSTVLLVDDETLTREILRDYLSSDPTIQIIGEASDGKAAVLQAAGLRPDVILMDMQMPVMDGVAATAQIHQDNPHIAILGLSTFSTDRYVVDLLRAGASGYLVKDAQPKEITEAIHKVMAGESVLSAEVTRHVVSGLADSIPAQVEPDAELSETLTDKELEVILLLGKGMSNREMAEELYVTESTIKARFVKVMEKLGVRDRVQILVKSMEYGLLDIKRAPRV
ncbi:response regulator [Arthrobacter sp. NIO-1057]|uniref:response regulator n=1 Tax=Arthrobacter sp. NIO-1057 TaxID=993071 RepID=UPI00071E3734|nr:response regulator transcription factor [Arthrobacter sp. NIO-1057]KSU65034.1 LuxR family transcriptional regulator [Arthrobacter sp. NIO-1057]SCC46179.1 two component transcriptional regulator, LuxR family [Arthrobacter sp. NIO-1057]